MKHITTRSYESPCGTLLLGSFGDSLCMCDWLVSKRHEQVCRRLKRALKAEMVTGTSVVIEKAAQQLDEYFARQRRSFDIPLLFVGTAFQRAVWIELQKIAYGETISYAEMAKRLGRPSAVRAVANANGANAIPIFAPCHRVIGSDRSLTGYAGGLMAKKMLLELETEN